MYVFLSLVTCTSLAIITVNYECLYVPKLYCAVRREGNHGLGHKKIWRAFVIHSGTPQARLLQLFY